MSFDTDFAAADSMFAEAFGVSVSYVRGASTTTLTAEVQLNEYKESGPEGGEIVVESRDYLITKADLSVTPRVGDQIKETIAGVVEIFEVMPVDGREYRSDVAKRKLLVHTKYAGSE